MKRILILLNIAFLSIAMLSMTMSDKYYGKSNAMVKTDNGQVFSSQNLYPSVIDGKLKINFKVSSFLDSDGNEMPHSLGMNNGAVITFIGDFPTMIKEGRSLMKINGILIVDGNELEHALPVRFEKSDQLKISIDTDLDVSSISQGPLVINLKSEDIELVAAK